MDALYLGLLAALVAASVVLVRLCERLRRPE